MVLAEELSEQVAAIFHEKWEKRDGNVVPESENLNLSNKAVELDAVVLYADIDESTALVDKMKAHFAAEVYKSFLHCAAKIIRSEDGTITAYDGDRIMAVFIGGTKNTSAVRAALKINYARVNIINPAIKNQYPEITYELRHTVGIDASKLFVTRTGVRGANDLVWVGRAANHAAKLCSLSADYPTRITSEVYEKLQNTAKVTDGRAMWEARTWTDMGRDIYGSSWTWSV